MVGVVSVSGALVVSRGTVAVVSVMSLGLHWAECVGLLISSGVDTWEGPGPSTWYLASCMTVVTIGVLNPVLVTAPGAPASHVAGFGLVTGSIEL